MDTDCNFKGLLRADGSPKSSYAAYSATTAMLRDATYDAPVVGMESPVVGLAFRRGEENVVALWHVGGSSQIQLQLQPAADLVIRDLEGSSAARDDVETFELPISNAPIYLEFASTSTLEILPEPQ